MLHLTGDREKVTFIRSFFGRDREEERKQMTSGPETGLRDTWHGQKFAGCRKRSVRSVKEARARVWHIRSRFSSRFVSFFFFFSVISWESACRSPQEEHADYSSRLGKERNFANVTNVKEEAEGREGKRPRACVRRHDKLILFYRISHNKSSNERETTDPRFPDESKRSKLSFVYVYICGCKHAPNTHRQRLTEIYLSIGLREYPECHVSYAELSRWFENSRQKISSNKMHIHMYI